MNQRAGQNVLFVCVQNAGRSQMAAAFARAAGWAARSAGSAPAATVHPEVADAMDEAGLSIRSEVPRALTAEDVEWADIVVTMGCGDACPVAPGTKYIDWELDDPHGQSPEAVRSIRDEIRRRIDALAGE